MKRRQIKPRPRRQAAKPLDKFSIGIARVREVGAGLRDVRAQKSKAMRELRYFAAVERALESDLDIALADLDHAAEFSIDKLIANSKVRT